MSLIKKAINKISTAVAASAVTSAVLIAPAYAQVQKVNDGMSNLQMLLAGVAVTTVTVAVMWAGYKMIFNQAKWADISNIFIGSMFIGGASGFAAFFVN